MNTPVQNSNSAEKYQPISEVFQCDAQGSLPRESNTDFRQNLLPPHVCIFNHEVFPNKPQINRRGSSKDVENLHKTFSSLECSIEIVCNPTLAMVKDTVRKLTLKSFDRLSGLVLVILSYGDDRIHTCDEKMYDLDGDVLEPLVENNSLSGKPKIVIIQASSLSTGHYTSKIPSPYIKCFSSTGGYFSYRNVGKGSFFIQVLCKEMDLHGLTKDFRSIIDDVNAMVESHAESVGRMQVPSITSTLRKPFCFGDYVQHANAPISRTSTIATVPRTYAIATVPGTSLGNSQLKLHSPLVYILNHEMFINSDKDRSGSLIDVKALRSTFESLNCDVHEVQNPTLAVVQDTFQKLETENLELRSALVIAILSHGDCNGLIEACDDTAYYLNKDVLFPLFRNDTLRGKPKILIVQACKGTLEADSNLIGYNPRDYIICYGTSEGFKAYRHTSFGSPFIQTLCQHMDRYGKKKDFLKIIQAVNQSVTEEAPLKYREMIPSYTSTLGKKKFYFWHNTYTE
ncbi:uncharacterized protein LOC128254441 isoform X2 [Drosophila gunungcola]|uniref:uncharacterized protein LOC128254441 isoform X2 n=1 Tax=Drosophila gunungcola TaxID=103775 RepID=UPI0022E8F198|nr:uncharacterized protein LOC128254441 isoform X2 [Drosophila gunungcola]